MERKGVLDQHYPRMAEKKSKQIRKQKLQLSKKMPIMGLWTGLKVDRIKPPQNALTLLPQLE